MIKRGQSALSRRPRTFGDSNVDPATLLDHVEQHFFDAETHAVHNRP